MNTDQTYDRIEAYLLGKMTQDERNAFETAVAMDADLRKALDAHSKAHAVINHGFNQQLKQRLTKIDNESRSAPKVRKLYRRVAAAAAIVLLAGLVSFLVQGPQYTNDALADQMFFTDQFDQFRSKGDALKLDVALATAQQLYKDGNYAGAQRAYEELAAEETVYQDLAEWNLLMCFLRQENIEQVNIRLQSILDETDHSFHTQAVKLERKMRHLFYRMKQ